VIASVAGGCSRSASRSSPSPRRPRPSPRRRARWSSRARGAGRRRCDRDAAHADDPQRVDAEGEADDGDRLCGGIAGLAVALGPVVGGAIVDGISWHWIFWVNVPIGVVLVPLALRKLDGVVLFVVWELHTDEPMLPMHLFTTNRTFAAANSATFLMYVGFFGAVFLITQYWQFAHGYSPLGAGLRILPWTVMPIFIAPLAGAAATKIGERPLLSVALPRRQRASAALEPALAT
jgi:hypothetical protein